MDCPAIPRMGKSGRGAFARGQAAVQTCRSSLACRSREASWTAAALCRFGAQFLFIHPIFHSSPLSSKASGRRSSSCTQPCAMDKRGGKCVLSAHVALVLILISRRATSSSHARLCQRAKAHPHGRNAGANWRRPDRQSGTVQDQCSARSQGFPNRLGSWKRTRSKWRRRRRTRGGKSHRY